MLVFLLKLPNIQQLHACFCIESLSVQVGVECHSIRIRLSSCISPLPPNSMSCSTIATLEAPWLEPVKEDILLLHFRCRVMNRNLARFHHFLQQLSYFRFHRPPIHSKLNFITNPIVSESISCRSWEEGFGALSDIDIILFVNDSSVSSPATGGGDKKVKCEPPRTAAARKNSTEYAYSRNYIGAKRPGVSVKHV